MILPFLRLSKIAAEPLFTRVLTTVDFPCVLVSITEYIAFLTNNVGKNVGENVGRF
jgi:hypothetical protein